MTQPLPHRFLRRFSRHYRELEVENKQLLAENVHLIGQQRLILDGVRQAQDRIGMARSLAHDLGIAFWLLDDLQQRYLPEDPRPQSSRWRERAALITDLRAYAAQLDPGEARTINLAATKMEALR